MPALIVIVARCPHLKEPSPPIGPIGAERDLTSPVKSLGSGRYGTILARIRPDGSFMVDRDRGAGLRIIVQSSEDRLSMSSVALTPAADDLDAARSVLQLEAAGLRALAAGLDRNFSRAVDLLAEAEG
ncbi:MAG: hypothetical protein ACRD4Q_12460, partial [Candidatus Acidiferrales bacterium]